MRVSHLRYVPLPGGDTAIRKPARTALAYLWASNLDWDDSLYSYNALCAEERSILMSQLKLKINTPLTSSMGRFFDAVASLCGVRQVVNYEAQAAIEFEALADQNEHGEYHFHVETTREHNEKSSQIDPTPLLQELLDDLNHSVPVARISARFHNTIARMICDTCEQIREDYGVNRVVLSGGVWQNMTLLHLTQELLSQHQFTVYIHHQVPTNDGGLALGQLAVAMHQMMGSS